jgi:hypothetical protein
MSNGEPENATEQPPPLPSARPVRVQVSRGQRAKEDETGSGPAQLAPDDEDVGPAQFPAGFWAGMDYLLHHPREIRTSLTADANLGALSGILFWIGCVTLAIYGAVMGATNLLQGSAMELSGKLLLVLVTAVKVPVLFLLTLFIVIPPIYVSNAFAGRRLSFRRLLASLLASLAVTGTVLASMGTVALFFALTSHGYHFIKLLHVVFFAYACLSGLAYLVRHVRLLAAGVVGGASPKLALLWLILYIFVGTQLAWVLRPFVGSPGAAFQVFRARSGNFYESVAHSLRALTSERAPSD